MVYSSMGFNKFLESRVPHVRPYETVPPAPRTSCPVALVESSPTSPSLGHHLFVPSPIDLPFLPFLFCHAVPHGAFFANYLPSFQSGMHINRKENNEGMWSGHPSTGSWSVCIGDGQWPKPCHVLPANAPTTGADRYGEEGP